jgi:putative ABC transport system permease protein
VTLSGVYPSYGSLRAWEPLPGGRFLNERDIAERRRVVVLGDRIKEGLFGAGEAVGRTLVLKGLPFTVVGVIGPKRQDTNYSGLDRDRACLPATTHERIFGRRTVSNFVYRSRGLDLQERATDRIYEVLGREYGFDPSDRSALLIFDTTEKDRMLSFVFLGLNLMLGGAGALTLFVGGVGVGNLMFVRVRQRTPEIGVQMALGATPRRVLLGVLQESLLLVGAGGAAGFAGALAVAGIVARTPLTEHIGAPAVSFAAGAGTVCLLGAVGVLAGYFPARRAAHLDPVAALEEGR